MKPIPNLLLLTVIVPLILRQKVAGNLLDTSVHRQKRSLIWFEGVNWIQMVAGIGLPIELKDQSITIGTVVKAYYLLPTNSSVYTHPSVDYEKKRRRRKRSPTRWITYRLIEHFLEKYGFGDGKACLLRSICEAASRPFDEKGGIFQEIIHAILTPSQTDDDLEEHQNSEYYAAEKMGNELHHQGNNNTSCSYLFSECRVNLMDKFTRLLNVSD